LDTPPGPRPFDGRHRLDLRWTISRQDNGWASVSQPGGVVETSVQGFGGGLDYYRWFREDLALALSGMGRAVDVSTYAGVPGTRTETTSISAFLVGVRWSPTRNPRASVRPHVTAQLGPYIGTGTVTSTGWPGTLVENKVLAVPGAYLSAGADFRIGSSFVLGAVFGAELPADFSQELSGSRSYRALQIGLSFGWTWGKGHTQR
jgi:hypothetical protein